MEVTISPVAIFEIVKDIQVKHNGSSTQGYLYGFPREDKIEVTTAFPTYSIKEEPKDKADVVANDEYKKSVLNFQNIHAEELKEHKFDYEHVGRYTSSNVGGRISFNDIVLQFEEQRASKNLFTLVVTIDGSSLSTRAFKVSEKAFKFMEEHKIEEIGYIADELHYKNFIEELKVTFVMTELDKVLVQQMLGEFNLVSDVFKLRDMDAMKDQMFNIYHSLDSVTTEVKNAKDDKKAIESNRMAREQWKKEREETNKQRVARKLDPKPLEDLDDEIPLLKQAPKFSAIGSIYESMARSSAAKAELEEEKTKIATLQAISK